MNNQFQQRLDNARTESEKWQAECLERGKDLEKIRSILDDCSGVMNPAILNKIGEIIYRN